MGKFTFVQWHKHGLKGDKLFKRGAVGTGLVRAFGVTLAVLVMMGFVVALTRQAVYNFSWLILFTVFAAATIGGGSAGAAAGIRGWQHGGAVGFIYGMFFVVVGFFTGIPVFDPVLIITAMTILGSIGGIVGVNLPSAKNAVHKRRCLGNLNK